MQFEDLKLFWKILNDFSCGFREIFQRKSGIMNKMKMVSFKLYFFTQFMIKYFNGVKFLWFLTTFEKIPWFYVFYLLKIIFFCWKSDFRSKFLVFEKNLSLKMKRKLFENRGTRRIFNNRIWELVNPTKLNLIMIFHSNLLHVVFYWIVIMKNNYD